MEPESRRAGEPGSRGRDRAGEPESRRAGEEGLNPQPSSFNPQLSTLDSQPFLKTSRNAPVVIIHNTGGEPTPEQAAEAEIAETLEALESALAALGRSFSRLTLEPPFSECAAALESLPREAVILNLFEGFPDDPTSEVQIGLLLKKLGLRATGCPPMAMHLGLHKDLCKELLAGSRLPVAEGLVLRSSEDMAQPLPFPFPAFLKPAADDASHGISADNLVRSWGPYRERAGELLNRFGCGVLVEPYLPGREFNCGIVESEEGPLPLPPSQVDYSGLPPEHPPVLTFAAKWSPGNPVFELTPTVCPAPVSPDLLEQIQSLSLRAFHAIRCRGYARVDLREDDAGRLVILEVNPNPDVAPSAGLAKQARARGWDYADLVGILLACAERGAPWAF